MRRVRNNIFETNSSSTHAICISKEHTYQIPTEKIFFELGEYGWEYDELYDTHTRASYLYTAIYEIDEGNVFINQLKERLEDNNISYEFGPTGEDCWGHIDHAGETREFVEWVLSSEENLLTYLFGDAFIITGNDNDDRWDYEMYPIESVGIDMYTDHQHYKSKFDGYDIFEKDN